MHTILTLLLAIIRPDVSGRHPAYVYAVSFGAAQTDRPYLRRSANGHHDNASTRCQKEERS
jgi:hypothetical protein